MSEKIQTFNDGIVRVYSVGDISEPGETPRDGLTFKYKLRFAEQTVGVYRFTQHMQHEARIDRLLRTQRLKDVTTFDVAVIEGDQYKIRQVQYPQGITPRSMDLSLERVAAKYALKKAVRP